MTTLDRLRFLLTSHGYKHANKFISNGQGVNITSHSCVSPPRPLSFHSKDIKEVFHRTAAKGHLTLTCSQLSKCFCTVSVNRLCWNCGSTVELFFCSSFKVIQPPDDDNTNYFDIMNCEQTFSLDTHKLQKRYVELQRSLHPDNFSQKSLKEQEYSERQSALVNKAYRMLQKPLSRAVYMLELKGILLEEGTDATADPQFLLEVMEVNESLAETQGQDEVSAIGQSVREKLKDLTKQINSSLSKGDLQTTKDLLTQMKYYTNIEEKVKERLTKGW
ncbi:iron-sulfur cluster co-chaperone protein HscB-like isoform X2 [Myxocyprinus asiaticus]|uniref:iron-sulfur cluster co-chaperone protein HscB-like isoform X2 n=1 Tax=Myxocyprinus asiaticus TaxID=70543 RepID=UPI0022220F00|nr:iron-sulfur cluster co-chaperone protein HscB-like isoform X2 [Myxocyprinus asiaticus]